MDIFKLVKEALEKADNEPHLSVVDEYMLAYALDPEDEDLLTAVEYDLEKVTYTGLVDGNQVFIGKDKQPIPLKEDEYKKRWVMISTSCLLGKLLLAEYEEIVKAAENQLPEHLKGKVFIK
jgi:hypothetical protein